MVVPYTCSVFLKARGKDSSKGDGKNLFASQVKGFLNVPFIVWCRVSRKHVIFHAKIIVRVVFSIYFVLVCFESLRFIAIEH